MPRAYCPHCGHKLERFAQRSDPFIGAVSPESGAPAEVIIGYHCPGCGRTVDPADVARREDPGSGAARDDQR